MEQVPYHAAVPLAILTRSQFRQDPMRTEPSKVDRINDYDIKKRHYVYGVLL